MVSSKGKPDAAQAPYLSDIQKGLTYTTNLSTDVVATTRDKIKICLMENEKAMRAQRDWIAPLSLLIGIVATLVSAEFREAMGMSKETWKALFCIGSIATSFWLLAALIGGFRNWKRGSVGYLVDRICATDETGAAPSRQQSGVPSNDGADS